VGEIQRKRPLGKLSKESSTGVHAHPKEKNPFGTRTLGQADADAVSSKMTEKSWETRGKKGCAVGKGPGSTSHRTRSLSCRTKFTPAPYRQVLRSTLRGAPRHSTAEKEGTSAKDNIKEADRAISDRRKDYLMSSPSATSKPGKALGRKNR